MEIEATYSIRCGVACVSWNEVDEEKEEQELESGDFELEEDACVDVEDAVMECLNNLFPEYEDNLTITLYV